MRLRSWTAAWFAAGALVAAAVLALGGEANAPGGWITGAPDDAARFERVERYLRGFDQPMWEVGDRYEKLHEALERGNYELALYHWDKIKLTIENGTLKRPARKANAEAMLLSSHWATVREGIASGDADRAWKAFDLARTACMSCHVAEKVGYFNDQSLLVDLTPPAARR